jgi:hypothetical protein
MRFLKKTAGRGFVLASFCPSILKLQGQESISVPNILTWQEPALKRDFVIPLFINGVKGDFNKSLKHIANLGDNFG